jgi:hypothetical protein
LKLTQSKPIFRHLRPLTFTCFSEFQTSISIVVAGSQEPEGDDDAMDVD